MAILLGVLLRLAYDADLNVQDPDVLEQSHSCGTRFQSDLTLDNRSVPVERTSHFSRSSHDSIQDMCPDTPADRFQ